MDTVGPDVDGGECNVGRHFKIYLLIVSIFVAAILVQSLDWEMIESYFVMPTKTMFFFVLIEKKDRSAMEIVFVAFYQTLSKTKRRIQRSFNEPSIFQAGGLFYPARRLSKFFSIPKQQTTFRDQIIKACPNIIGNRKERKAFETNVFPMFRGAGHFHYWKYLDKQMSSGIVSAIDELNLAE